jgi:hypothetical protein
MSGTGAAERQDGDRAGQGDGHEQALGAAQVGDAYARAGAQQVEGPGSAR